MTKKIGKQSFILANPVRITGTAAVVGQKEGEGPLRDYFDYISDDSRFGESSWEKAESTMLRQCFYLACDNAEVSPRELDCVFAGDLLNQCMGSADAMKNSKLPYFGLYGACSTMGESLMLAAMTVDGGFAEKVCAATSSHFCSSERQFRFPLEYGGQRTPTAQWTVTGAGAAILQNESTGICVTCVTPGIIVDAGITDANNMGSAMAPAAYDTLKNHFADTGRSPDYYDLIVTGDLGAIGHDTLEDLFRHDGNTLGDHYTDCGLLIFDRSKQDVHAGGSGCGCAASVLCSYIMDGFRKGMWSKVLFAPTGALLSPTTTQQGESIPGICHAIAIENM